ncbi:hypothetical protein OOJ09_28080 [Mesorhizobium qingshengii]|uniref:Uncharacterized protein n=1 Tax=Mesorhizobium qingshengii TaxID=1165689 RepID=A0ABT4R3B9_9HYPH|nr:hypothetical protein [Mesorhizobium qingshengii]MCZ8548053.1 hypothetical protein [Mesorhizobium qingshengii]
MSFAQRRWDGNKHWQEFSVDVSEARAMALNLLGQDEPADIYISQHAFHGRRLIAHLAALGACYVDIDYMTQAAWAGRSPSVVLGAIQIELEDEGLPQPSYVLNSGRGLLLVWLHELLPRRALPRWNRVQQRLAEALKSFGADKRALDAARVFRLVGSVNSKAEWERRKVSMIWCQGSPEMPTRYLFDTLADEVLRFTRCELVLLRNERAKRRAAHQDTHIAPARVLTAGTYWGTVLDDLQRLRAHRCPEGALPAGQRDAWLFCAATAMSWLAPEAVMRREIAALADEAAGWTERHTRERLGAVIRRAQDAAAGKKIIFQGRDVDCRYRMRSGTIVDWLQIEPAEQKAAGLRVLIGEDRSRELAAERARKSRHTRGAAAREEQQAARLRMGHAALYLAASEGMGVSDLAARFGCSAGQISKAMREARQDAG